MCFYSVNQMDGINDKHDLREQKRYIYTATLDVCSIFIYGLIVWLFILFVFAFANLLLITHHLFICICLFVTYLFIYLCIHLFGLFIYLFICLFIHLIISSFVYLLVYFIYSCIYSCIYSLFYSFIYLFYPFISLLLIYSFT